MHSVRRFALFLLFPFLILGVFARDPQTAVGQSQPLGARPAGHSSESGTGFLRARIVPVPNAILPVAIYSAGVLQANVVTDTMGYFECRECRGSPTVPYEVRVRISSDREYVQRVAADALNIVVIVITADGIHVIPDDGSAGKSGTLIGLSSLQVPREAAGNLEKGRQAARKQKYAEALRLLQTALKIFPRYAEALTTLGAVHRAENRLDDAEQAFRNATTADASWLPAYLQLADLQTARDQIRPLLETSQRILQLEPGRAEGHYYQSLAYLGLGRLLEADEAAAQADREDNGRLPSIHLVLARIDQRRGVPAEAAQHLRDFLKEVPRAPNRLQIENSIQSLQAQAGGAKPAL